MWDASYSSGDASSTDLPIDSIRLAWEAKVEALIVAIVCAAMKAPTQPEAAHAAAEPQPHADMHEQVTVLGPREGKTRMKSSPVLRVFGVAMRICADSFNAPDRMRVGRAV